MKRSTAIGALILTLLVLPCVAAAQDVATSLDELVRSQGLQHGDGVYVTGAAGMRVKGNITSVSTTGLEITTGREMWTLPARDVKEIERRDSVKNGIWLGVASGMGAYYAMCASSSYLIQCIEYTPSAGLFLSGIGALLGWGIDTLITKTVYEKTGSTQLSASPLVSTAGVGATASIRWFGVGIGCLAARRPGRLLAPDATPPPGGRQCASGGRPRPA